jgi:hypothetical protein
MKFWNPLKSTWFQANPAEGRPEQVRRESLFEKKEAFWDAFITSAPVSWGTQLRKQ